MASSALVVAGKVPSQEAVLALLQEAYLDPMVTTITTIPCHNTHPTLPSAQVWDRAEKLYRRFCEKRAGAGLPPLAVLLSIL
jgi:hypothetical protein